MTYWVDFSGYACIEADSPEQAEEKMWEAIHNAFDGRTVFDIDCIEERVDGDPLEPVYKTTAQDLEDFWHDR